MFARVTLTAALSLALLAGGCVTSPETSARGWGQIAAGVGQVVGTTPYDAKIQKTVDKIYESCATLRTVAALGTILAPEGQQRAAAIASATVSAVCDTPPAGDATAVQAVLKTATTALDAALAAKKTGGV